MPSTNINRILDRSYLDLLTEIDFRPIVIMGIYRSGTTLLQEILVATQCFNYLSSYHVVNYNELLYNSVNQTENQARQKVRELFESLGIVTRGFDNLRRTIDSAEEYGVILSKTGYKRYLNSENLHQFIEICQKVQFISKVDRPILLKNPWCFPHFMFIKSVFPNAKFIFIHREPIHVINSLLKLTRSVWSKKNVHLAVTWEKYNQMFDNPVQRGYWWLLNSEYFDMGVRRATKRHIKWTTYFLQNIGSLSNQDYVSVRYEDFCKEPRATIFKILDFIGLEAKVPLDYEQFIQPRPLKLLPDVERKSEQIRKQLQPYLTYCGYDWTLER